MYKAEALVESDLFSKARSMSESPDQIKELNHALEMYLNYKPGTWRLVSHSATIEALPYGKIKMHYFVWSTGA